MVEQKSSNRRFRLRPQILTSIVALGALGIVSMFLGYPEVATACPAGIVALGMKLLESEEK